MYYPNDHEGYTTSDQAVYEGRAPNFLHFGFRVYCVNAPNQQRLKCIAPTTIGYMAGV
jgi:hypothetical protein